MNTIARKLWKPVLLLAGLILAGIALRELRAAGVLDSHLGETLAAQGVRGEVLFIILGTLATAIGLPRQVVAFAGGTGFGMVLGSALTLLATVLGCLASFFWARLIGRDWARRRLSGKLARLDSFLAANPFTATLTLRLLPVGHNLGLNLLAGLTGIAWGPFVLASALGYVPQTVVFAVLGKGVRVDGSVQITLGLVLFAASITLGFWLLRRHRHAQDLAEAAADPAAPGL